jgi:hypothetical protein
MLNPTVLLLLPDWRGIVNKLEPLELPLAVPSMVETPEAIVVLMLVSQVKERLD